MPIGSCGAIALSRPLAAKVYTQRSQLAASCVRKSVRASDITTVQCVRAQCVRYTHTIHRHSIEGPHTPCE